jgi:hypothetical protein
MPNWASAGKQGWKYLKPFFDDLPDHFDWLIRHPSGKPKHQPAPPRFHSTVEQALGNKKMPQSMAPDKLRENLTKYGARQSELDYIDLDAIPVNEKGKVTLEAVSEAHDQSLLGVMADRRSGVGRAVQTDMSHEERIRHIEGLQTHNNARTDITDEEKLLGNERLEREWEKMHEITSGQIAPDGRPWSEAKEDFPELYEKKQAFETIRPGTGPQGETLDGMIINEPRGDQHEAMAMRDLGIDDPNHPDVRIRSAQLFRAAQEEQDQYLDAVSAYGSALNEYTYKGTLRTSTPAADFPETSWSANTAGGAESPATRHYENLIRDVSGSPFRIGRNYLESLDEFRNEFRHGGDFSEIITQPQSGDYFLQEMGGVPVSFADDTGLHYHWDEPNVLAHTRLQDVVVHDPVTGNPVRGLNINEIQSDYAQSARKIYDDIVDMRFQDRLRSGDLDFFNEITAGIDDIGGRTRATNLTPDDIRRGFTEGTGYDPDFPTHAYGGLEVEDRLNHLQQQFADVLYASHSMPDLRAADELGPQFIANARKAEIKRMRNEGITGFLSDSDMDWWDQWGAFDPHYRVDGMSNYQGILPYGDVAGLVNPHAYRPGMLTQTGQTFGPGMPLNISFVDPKHGRSMPLSALQMPPLYGRNDWERIGLLDSLSMAEGGFSGPSGHLFRQFDLQEPGPYEFITWTPPEGVMATSGTPVKSAIQTYGYGPTEGMSDIIARADAYGQPIASTGRTATYPEIYGPSYLGDRAGGSRMRDALLSQPDFLEFSASPMIYNALRKIGKGGAGIETHPVTHRFEIPGAAGDPYQLLGAANTAGANVNYSNMVPGAQVNQNMLRLTPSIRDKIKGLALPAIAAPVFIHGMDDEDEGAGVYEHLYEY